MSIPDEKSRAWTRLEDYWPPIRFARRRRPSPFLEAGQDRGDPLDHPRPLLGIVPFALLMAGLALLAVAIIVAAWPGRRASIRNPEPQAAEIGTAPRGWMDGA